MIFAMQAIFGRSLRSEPLLGGMQSDYTAHAELLWHVQVHRSDWATEGYYGSV